MTVHHTVEESWLAGSIRFEADVPKWEIESFMFYLKENGPRRWIQLHYRQGGDDGSHILSFIFILQNEDKETREKFEYALFRDLKEKFGTYKRKKAIMPKGIKSWCISPVEACI